MDTKQLARMYHVNLMQGDLEELGAEVSRERFKEYFGIPDDADDDPNYKRDPNFDLDLLQ